MHTTFRIFTLPQVSCQFHAELSQLLFNATVVVLPYCFDTANHYLDMWLHKSCKPSASL